MLGESIGIECQFVRGVYRTRMSRLKVYMGMEYQGEGFIP